MIRDLITATQTVIEGAIAATVIEGAIFTAAVIALTGLATGMWRKQ